MEKHKAANMLHSNMLEYCHKVAKDNAVKEV